MSEITGIRAAAVGTWHRYAGIAARRIPLAREARARTHGTCGHMPVCTVSGLSGHGEGRLRHKQHDREHLKTGGPAYAEGNQGPDIGKYINTTAVAKHFNYLLLYST